MGQKEKRYFEMTLTVWKKKKKEQHNDSFRFIHPFMTMITLFQAESYKGIS